MDWGTDIEAERRRRILVLTWAYAYEFLNTSLVSDHVFDEVCKRVDLSIKTGKYDEWFVENFDPSTGIWIHTFPDLEGIKKRASLG